MELYFFMNKKFWRIEPFKLSLGYAITFVNYLPLDVIALI